METPTPHDHTTRRPCTTRGIGPKCRNSRNRRSTRHRGSTWAGDQPDLAIKPIRHCSAVPGRARSRNLSTQSGPTHQQRRPGPRLGGIFKKRRNRPPCKVHSPVRPSFAQRHAIDRRQHPGGDYPYAQFNRKPLPVCIFVSQAFPRVDRRLSPPPRRPRTHRSGPARPGADEFGYFIGLSRPSRADPDPR